MNATALEIEPTVPDPNYRAQIIGFPRTDPDFQLVARTAVGDDSAFSELVGKFRPYLQSVAYNLLRCHQDAEEIADDALLRARRGAAGFEGRCTVKTWLVGIAINLARNRYWWHARRKRGAHISVDSTLGESGFTVGDSIPDENADVRLDADLDEFQTRAFAALYRLSENHTEILRLSIFEGLNYKQLADRLSITLGTVKSRMARAREALRANMAPE